MTARRFFISFVVATLLYQLSRLLLIGTMTLRSSAEGIFWVGFCMILVARGVVRR